MKKILILLAFLLLAFQVEGQVIRANPFAKVVVSSGTTLTDGLIVYYKMDETSGTNLNDEVSTNDATCNSDADVNATGKFEKAVDFTPDGGAITIPNAVFATVTDKLSLSMWVKFDALGSTLMREELLLVLVAADATVVFKIIMNNTNRLQAFQKNNANGSFYNTSTAITDVINFMHIVVVYEGVGGDILIYLNGTDVSQREETVTGSIEALSSAEHTLGNSWSLGSVSLDGRMDEIGIWDRVLTIAEIAELYNSGTGITYPF